MGPSRHAICPSSGNSPIELGLLKTSPTVDENEAIGKPGLVAVVLRSDKRLNILDKSIQRY